MFSTGPSLKKRWLCCIVKNAYELAWPRQERRFLGIYIVSKEGSGKRLCGLRVSMRMSQRPC